MNKLYNVIFAFCFISLIFYSYLFYFYWIEWSKEILDSYINLSWYNKIILGNFIYFWALSLSIIWLISSVMMNWKLDKWYIYLFGSFIFLYISTLNEVFKYPLLITTFGFFFTFLLLVVIPKRKNNKNINLRQNWYEVTWIIIDTEIISDLVIRTGLCEIALIKLINPITWKEEIIKSDKYFNINLEKMISKNVKVYFNTKNSNDFFCDLKK